jgi:hypothetical protein
MKDGVRLLDRCRNKLGITTAGPLTSPGAMPNLAS